MLQRHALLLLALVAILTSQGVYAWGQTGHRVTGAIAEQYLSPTAQARVRAILGVEDLAEASTWPDEMRSNPSKFWQDVAGPFHYVTVPPGKTYAEVGAPEQGNSVTALTRFSDILKDPDASLEQQQLALRFIVHIVGDLHQPLHAGNGEDRGGNEFKVEFFREASNLHRVWDSGIIDRKQLSYTEWTSWLTRQISPQQAYEWQNADPLVWIAESTQLRDQIYPEDTNISWQYQYQHMPTVKLRLAQGGLRIAAYLNALFAN